MYILKTDEHQKGIKEKAEDREEGEEKEEKDKEQVQIETEEQETRQKEEETGNGNEEEIEGTEGLEIKENREGQGKKKFTKKGQEDNRKKKGKACKTWLNQLLYI